ncbi:MAG: hypothetical protein ACP5T4_00805 [Candidatus Micrarchaeia archaeon]
MHLANIYAYKNLDRLILLPFLLLIFGIIFSFRVPLDSSLRGGVSISLVTNASIPVSELASRISTQMHISGISVAKSPGGFQITLPINESLASADAQLEAFYADEANYSSLQLNATALQLQLQRNQSNATAKALLANDSKLLAIYESRLRNYSVRIMDLLAPFVASNSSLNATSNFSVASLQNAVQQAYSKASSIYENRTMSELKSIIPFSSFSFDETTPTLGKYFLSQFKTIIIVAFVLVFFSVFFIFRSFVPSLTVTFGAANDMIFALGMMGLLGIPLGVSSIAGLLMIIGYAIDTDVLTAIRILKRGEGGVEERAYESMRTGLTMTFTAILSFSVLFIVSLIVYVPTYYEISGVVLMGLIGDIFTTWFGNAPLLMLYKKKKERV